MNFCLMKKLKETLNEISQNSNQEIPCKPVKKVEDDNMIVGIITETNQFVPVIPEVYEENGEQLEDLPVIHNKGTNNVLQTDSELMNSQEIDMERTLLMKKIDLENNFYNLFRNTFKVIINYEENKEIKNEMLDVVKNITITYKNKLVYLKNVIKRKLKVLLNFIFLMT